MQQYDEKLEGGNMTTVFKQGDTVIREQKKWSPTVHRLLLHLESEQFEYSPRFIGVDSANNEILSYMRGSCLSDAPLTTDLTQQLLIIRTLANLMRNYHDATTTFNCSKQDSWMFSYDGPLEKEVICHNDIAPYNITFINNIPYGMIDFDTCCPAPRIWDIVYALYRFVPISHTTDIDTAYLKKNILQFFNSYDMACPKDFFDQLIARLQTLADFIYSEAYNGNRAFEIMLAEGHRDYYLREIDFINQHKKSWENEIFSL